MARRLISLSGFSVERGRPVGSENPEAWGIGEKERMPGREA